MKTHLHNKKYIRICKYFFSFETQKFDFCGKELTTKTTTIEIPKPLLNENEEEILKLFSQLTERQQLKLIVKAEDMVEENQKDNSQENVG